MMTNPILASKYKTRKQCTEEAQHDLARYVENSHSIVRKVEAQYGVKFHWLTLMRPACCHWRGTE